MAAHETNVPVFAGKALELQQDGSGWRLKLDRVEVHVSYSLNAKSWHARVWVNGRVLASCDYALTAETAARVAEENMRETVSLMNEAVNL